MNLERLSFGDEQRGWTFQVFAGLTHVSIGWSIERYQHEAQVTIHLGPFHLVWWWLR